MNNNDFDANVAKVVNCSCPWNARAWRNTPDYQYEYCISCNQIKSFRWHSLWKHLKNFFYN